MAKHSVLVADADPRSLRILEVALRKAGFIVATASDGPEALRRVQRSPPDLVLSEVQLPGGDGYALCEYVRSDSKLASTPFLLMSGDREPQVKMRATEVGADDFLLKPLPIKELVGRVRLLLEGRTQERLAQRGAPSGSMTGSVSDLGLVDLFQSLENWRKTALVTCEAKGQVARVWVRDGQIIDAELLPLERDAAFYRLLNWDKGDFRVDFGPVERDRAIEGGTQGMLLEGMRRLDEAARIAERIPMDAAFAVDTLALLAKLPDLPDEVNGILRLFDGRRSVEQVLEVSPVDDLSTLAIVERLIGEAVLTRPDPRSLHKPSLQEWLGAPGATMLPPGDVTAAPPISRPPPPAAAPPQTAPEPQPASAQPNPQQTALFHVPAAPAQAASSERSELDVVITDKIRVPASLLEAEAARERAALVQAAADRHARGGARGAGPGIERLLFPPLRGVRRERLRREAEQVRAAVGAGNPVRLLHALELPAWADEGTTAPPPSAGSRRISPAVSDEAKRLTTIEPPVIPSRRAKSVRPAEPKPAEPKPAEAKVAVEASSAAPTTIAPDDSAAARSATAITLDEAPPAPQVVAPPPAAPAASVVEAAAPAPIFDAAIARPAVELPPPAPIEAALASSGRAARAESAAVLGSDRGDAAVLGAGDAAARVTLPEQSPVAAAAARPSRHLGMVLEEDDDITPPEDGALDAEMRAALGRGQRRWPIYAGAAALGALAIWAFALRGPPTDKKDAPWLEGEKNGHQATAAAGKAPAAQANARKSVDAAGVVVKAEPKAEPAPAEEPTDLATAPEAPAAPPAQEPSVRKPRAGKAESFSKAMSAGESLLKRGKYKQAVAEFKKAVDANGSSVPALLALGDAFLEADLPKKALDPLNKAANLDPQNGRAQLLLGTAHQSLARNRDAVVAYQRYLELDPAGEFARDVRSILANLTR